MRALLFRVVSLASVAACGSAAPPPAVLVLHEFVQNGDDAVSLSEPLVFHFVQDLDRASVTSESVRVHEARDPARRARGTFRIHRGQLEFVPDLPRARDLSDGGLSPGVEYVVELAGFPRPDALRSEEGGQLSSTLRLPFRTARVSQRVFVGSEPRDFLKIDPEQRGPASVEIGPLDPIVLLVDEAVDPTSLAAGEFEILPKDGDPQHDIVPLVPRLTENRRGRARIELAPAGGALGDLELRALEVGTYFLTRSSPRAANLGGHVLPFRAPGHVSELVRVEVRAPRVERRLDTLAERPYYGDPRFEEAGGDGARFAFDGTAHWRGREGGVTLRLPAAVGDGGDGALDPFLALEGRTDVQATRLRVPPEGTVDLSEAHGFLVLRAQGSLDVEGVLRRELPGDWSDVSLSALERAGATGSDLPLGLAAELYRRRNYAPETWEPLSAWLARARALNEPWTVLIAGGDLRVTGSIDVEGPLLLVAGGWIRFEGDVRDNPLVFKSVDGGGSLGRVHTASLQLDEPELNPLAAPLRVAVLTNTFRPLHGVAEWLDAQPTVVPGGGAAKIFFRGLRDRAGGVEPDRFVPVEDIELLDGCQALQLLLVLEMPAGAGEPWRPPRIDAVELSWEVPR